MLLRSKAFGGSKKPKYLQEYICEEKNNEVKTFEDIWVFY